MRRASAILAALSLGLLALPAVGSAAPTVKLKAELVKIPGFAHTGDILGAGAALKSEFLIEGNEYHGHQPPIKSVTVHFPTGTKIVTKGFATCPTATILEEKNPEKCPKASKAGPTGHAKGFVFFGTEEVEEETTIEPFFAPGGGINFFVAGHHPAIIEITSQGNFSSLGNAGGFGPTFVAEVPFIETVPGAPDASAEKIITQVGAAYKKGKKTVYYGTVPKKCPKGGFPLKAEITFGGVQKGLDSGSPEVTSHAEYKAPCPRK